MATDEIDRSNLPLTPGFRETLRDAADEEIEYLNLQALSKDDCATFQRALERGLQRIEGGEVSGFASPEFYSTYKDLVASLISLLSALEAEYE